MKKLKLVSCIIALITVFTVCIHAVSPCVSAIVNTNGSISLHVADSKKKVPMQGVSFRLYFFAAAYEKANGIGYDYVVPYDECKMDMDNLQDAYLAVHLSHFALTHNLPFTEKASDSKGNITFGDLKPGVYLILPTNIPEGYYLPSPFVINIPVYNHEQKNWEYDIIATPKMQIFGSSSDGTTYLSVKKAWVTDEETPEKITVSLLRDLKEVEKVELNEKNNWHYRWNNLDCKHTWSVVEGVVPDGYKVSYDFSSNSVIITNTKDDYTENTTKPEDTTVPESTTKPQDTTVKPEGTTKPLPPTESTTKPEELIDTGQLNWPVPIFSAAGLVLFSIGWALLNFGKKDEEAL